MNVEYEIKEIMRNREINEKNNCKKSYINKCQNKTMHMYDSEHTFNLYACVCSDTGKGSGGRDIR